MLQQVLVLQQELVHARLRLQPGCCLRGQLVLQQVDLRDRGQPRQVMGKPEGGKAGRECPGAKCLFVSAQLPIYQPCPRALERMGTLLGGTWGSSAVSCRAPGACSRHGDSSTELPRSHIGTAPILPAPTAPVRMQRSSIQHRSRPPGRQSMNLTEKENQNRSYFGLKSDHMGGGGALCPTLVGKAGTGRGGAAMKC